jgi:acyl-CoA synthetase (AMP-forming)/AMP-acid ligase II
VNLMMLLEMARSTFGDRVALTSEGRSFTYADLYAAAGRAAARLRGREIAHAAYLDVASPAVPIGLFAGAWAGLPFVPLNYRLTDDALDALLERIRPAALVTHAAAAARLGGRPGLTVTSRDAFLEDLATGDVPPGDWSTDPGDVAILLFTSGTTGEPKAAVLRQKHLVSYILGSVEFMGAEETDATLVSVPPYHIAGLAAVLSSVYAGRRIVQLPSFSAEAWLALAREEAVTHAFVVPTMLARIVDALEGRTDAGLPALRAISYGGGRMPQPVIERAMALFPSTDFTNAYGLTETSSTISILGPDDHRAAMASEAEAARRRIGSVGRPLPTVEVEIRDADGKPVPAGTPGEIHVRGEQVSGEYLGRGSLVAEDGFFPTRDGGFLDEEGYLFLEGRIDDVIVRGGENLSPGEIEDVLMADPAVRDAAVVGVPDEQWGEAIAAVVVPRDPGAAGEALRDALRARVRRALRSSRVPDRIEFRSALPYNETGKLLRREVRAWLEAEKA